MDLNASAGVVVKAISVDILNVGFLYYFQSDVVAVNFVVMYPIVRTGIVVGINQAISSRDQFRAYFVSFNLKNDFIRFLDF